MNTFQLATQFEGGRERRLAVTPMTPGSVGFQLVRDSDQGPVSVTAVFDTVDMVKLAQFILEVAATGTTKEVQA